MFGLLHNEGEPCGAVQYAMTWFINPNPLPYFEVVALEANF
jgi:hypothetical protein